MESCNCVENWGEIENCVKYDKRGSRIIVECDLRWLTKRKFHELVYEVMTNYDTADKI